MSVLIIFTAIAYRCIEGEWGEFIIFMGGRFKGSSFIVGWT